MPSIKLTSFGATEEVTGSCHLLEIDNYKLLIDCGLFQGDFDNYLKNWDEWLFNPKNVDAVILTHAHLDHCGRLPKLYAGGFRGKVYATPPTIQLADVVLEDSYFIMAQKAFRRHLPKLYTPQDLQKTKNSFVATDYYQTTRLNNNINFTFHDAGHILGSSIVELKIGNKTIVFSGDIGGQNMPLVKNIDYLTKADYVITESTYGDRNHEEEDVRDTRLLELVKKVTAKNSTLLIAIFAIERTQDILKVLNDYYESHLDFNVPVYLDSPMAYKATQIYKKNIKYLNEASQKSLVEDNDIFSFPQLKISNTIRQSKKINSVPPPKIIMAGSGMLEGGRMIHHLAHYLKNEKNQILFVGYQVPGTLGHKILDGAFHFDYYGKKSPIRAAVDQIDGFSAHADQKALLNWVSHFKKPKKILLSHGNLKALQTFSQLITDKLGYQNEILKLNNTIEL